MLKRLASLWLNWASCAFSVQQRLCSLGRGTLPRPVDRDLHSNGIDRAMSSIQVQNSVVFVATSAEQAVSFSELLDKVSRFPNLLDIADPDATGRKAAFLVKRKKHVFLWKLAPHKKKTERKDTQKSFRFCPLIAGDAPSLAKCVLNIRGRGSGTEFQIRLKSFVWRPSEQIGFFANSSATPKRWQPYLSALWRWELFKVRENWTRVLQPNSLINYKEVASSPTRQEEIQCHERRSPQKLSVMPDAFNESWQTLDDGRL